MVKRKVSNKKVPVSGGMNKNLVVGIVVVLLLVGVFLYFNNQKEVGLMPGMPDDGMPPGAPESGGMPGSGDAGPGVGKPTFYGGWEYDCRITEGCRCKFATAYLIGSDGEYKFTPFDYASCAYSNNAAGQEGDKSCETACDEACDKGTDGPFNNYCVYIKKAELYNPQLFYGPLYSCKKTSNSC